MAKKYTYALVIVDMQNAYFNNEVLEERRHELIRACNELIAGANDHAVPIFYATTLHKKDRSTWTLNMLEDGKGYLFEGEEDVDVVEGLDLRGANEIIKTRDSTFFRTSLAQELLQQKIDTIVLAGVSTHTCIFQTAADAYAHNFRVILASEAIATHDPGFHRITINLLNQEYRQRAKTNHEIISQLSQ